MDANELASRVAHKMLAGEGTGPAWGIRIEDVREAYARISMVVRADMAAATTRRGRTSAKTSGAKSSVSCATVVCSR